MAEKSRRSPEKGKAPKGARTGGKRPRAFQKRNVSAAAPAADPTSLYPAGAKRGRGGSLKPHGRGAGHPKGGRTHPKGKSVGRGQGRGRKGPTPAPAPRQAADDADFKSWQMGPDKVPVDLGKIAMWRDLYTRTSPLGVNVTEPPKRCPVAGCEESSLIPGGVSATASASATPKDICRIRIKAMFSNLRVCQAHYGEVWPVVENLANVASSDLVRESLAREPDTLTPEEIKRLKAPFMSLFHMWSKIKIKHGPWVSPGLTEFREGITRYALKLTYKVPLTLEQVAAKAELDPPNWRVRYGYLKSRVELDRGEGPAEPAASHMFPPAQPQPSYPRVSPLSLAAAPWDMGDVAQALQGEEGSPYVESEPSEAQVAAGGDEETQEQTEEGEEAAVKQPPRKSRKTGAGPPVGKGRRKGTKAVTVGPTVTKKLGEPQIHFATFPRHLFAGPLTLQNAKRTRWPPPTIIKPGSLSAEDAAKSSGYWVEPAACIFHPLSGGHFCWDRHLVADLRRMKGRGSALPDQSVLTLDILSSFDSLLIPEWNKQATYLSKLRTLADACTEGKDENKFEQDRESLHDATWPHTWEVTGLPPLPPSISKWWNTTPPEPAFEGALADGLQQTLLGDYPEGKLIPRHIALWLVEKAPEFRGVDPNIVLCLYEGDTPSIERTRKVIAAYRFHFLVEAAFQWAHNGKVEIPNEVERAIRAAYPYVQFAGNTVKGLNQALVYHLSYADEKGDVEVRLGQDEPLLSATTAWAIATSGNPTEWGRRQKKIGAKGTLQNL